MKYQRVTSENPTDRARPPDPKNENPDAPASAIGANSKSDKPAEIITSPAWAQAAFLVRRYGLAPAFAATVAEMAFHNGRAAT